MKTAAIIVWVLVAILVFYVLYTNGIIRLPKRKDKFKHPKLKDVRRSWFTSDQLDLIDEASQYPEFNMSHEEVMESLRDDEKNNTQ